MKKAALILILLGCLAGVTYAQSNHNIGLGIILGEPTGLTFKLWNKQTMAFDAGAAWSFVSGGYFQVHGDLLLHNFNLFRCIFRPKVASGSGSNWPRIPGESGHLFRLIPATFSRCPESAWRRWMTVGIWAMMFLPGQGGDNGTEKVIHA